MVCFWFVLGWHIFCTADHDSPLAKKSNNQALFVGSLLKNSMEVDSEATAAMELQLDETGVHQVCTNYVL